MGFQCVKYLKYELGSQAYKKCEGTTSSCDFERATIVTTTSHEQEVSVTEGMTHDLVLQDRVYAMRHENRRSNQATYVNVRQLTNFALHCGKPDDVEMECSVHDQVVVGDLHTSRELEQIQCG